MMTEGPDGFVGGLSAHNYRTITDAASATATRDLAELVELGALERAGERRYARYHLAIATNARGVTGSPAASRSTSAGCPASLKWRGGGRHRHRPHGALPVSAAPPLSALSSNPTP